VTREIPEQYRMDGESLEMSCTPWTDHLDRPSPWMNRINSMNHRDTGAIQYGWRVPEIVLTTVDRPLGLPESMN